MLIHGLNHIKTMVNHVYSCSANLKPWLTMLIHVLPLREPTFAQYSLNVLPCLTIV